MAQFLPGALSANLVDKVIVLTGGANGIGSATVSSLWLRGAHVIFGDVDTEQGNALVERLRSSGHSTSANIEFCHTDVTIYEQVLRLFERALEKYERVDYAISIAGIFETGQFFRPKMTLEEVKERPKATEVDVNLLGALYFSRIAWVYLQQNATPGTDKALILTSSSAGFKATAGIPVYSASKHGIVGLMRSLRETPTGIRINTICPWATDTEMIAALVPSWKAAELPLNSPEDVANIIIGVAGDKKVDGCSFFIEGGRAWEIEKNMDRFEPQWLGEEQSKTLARGQQFLAKAGPEWV